jgi:hypothetical protein
MALSDAAVELGCPGHFVLADKCRWRRHTQVGRYRISTVGDYRREPGAPRDTVNSSHYFETMVFETTDEEEEDSEECGCRRLTSLTPLETDRYRTAGEAQRGHEAMVKRYVDQHWMVDCRLSTGVE